MVHVCVTGPLLDIPEIMLIDFLIKYLSHDHNITEGWTTVKDHDPTVLQH